MKQSMILFIGLIVIWSLFAQSLIIGFACGFAMFASGVVIWNLARCASRFMEATLDEFAAKNYGMAMWYVFFTLCVFATVLLVVMLGWGAIVFLI